MITYKNVLLLLGGGVVDKVGVASVVEGPEGKPEYFVKSYKILIKIYSLLIMLYHCSRIKWKFYNCYVLLAYNRGLLCSILSSWIN